MRKLLISAILLGTVASAAPAAAQYRGNYGYNQGQNINQQLRSLQQRVDQLFQRRLISNNEARRLSRRIDGAERQYDRFRRDGLSRGEYAQIQDRIRFLRSEIREERQENRQDWRDDRRDDRRDRWDD